MNNLSGLHIIVAAHENPEVLSPAPTLRQFPLSRHKHGMTSCEDAARLRSNKKLTYLPKGESS